MSRSTLPPLAAVRAFEAAARYQSLRQAADALGVTPSAVSHQIRVLEAWVGTPVFQRIGRDVRLSSVGLALAADVGRAFAILTEGLAVARRDATQSTLRVSTLPLFAQAWLIPRLGRFEAAHPGISIVIDTSNRLADFDREPVDLAIRSSTKPSPGLFTRKLLDLKAIPLCAPRIAARIKHPSELSQTTLIHLSAGTGGWKEWLELSGQAGLRPRANLTVDTMPAAIAAAVAGRGVMLGLHPIVWEAASAQTLVNPFAGPLLGAGAYYVVHRKPDRSRRTVAAFVEWLTTEMRDDLRRLRAR